MAKPRLESRPPAIKGRILLSPATCPSRKDPQRITACPAQCPSDFSRLSALFTDEVVFPGPHGEWGKEL